MSQFELPEGWFNTTIQDVAEVKGGKRLPKGKALTDQKTPHAYIRVTDMNNGSIDQSDIRYIDEETYKEISNYFISKDDLYISIAGTIGLVGDIPNELDGANLTENAAKICSLIGVEKHYLKYVLNSLIAKEQFEDKVTSSGQPKLALFRIRDCKFPLPPLAEQQVIADKLDTLLAQVESIKARLERIPEILKQFRQSVLAAAVSGKLTEEWDVQDCLLSDVVEFQNGYAFKSEWFSDTGVYQVIKLGNIRDGRLFIENAPAYVDRKIGQEFERFKPTAGDTLISMTGTRFKQDYGFGCLVETDQDILINQRVGRLIPIREKITPEFLNLFIRSEQFRRQFFQGETGGVNQGNVGSKHIMSLSIKVPRIEIQIEVVNKVIKALNAVTVIERQAELALERVNNLTQSILAKAFRGELTAEWREANPELISGENSAEALLKRIKAERESAKPTTKRGRAKT